MEQQIFSHAKFGDGNYGNKEDCDWVIEAPPGIKPKKATSVLSA